MFPKDLNTILPIVGLGLYAQANHLNISNNTTTLIGLYALMQQQREIEKLACACRYDPCHDHNPCHRPCPPHNPCGPHMDIEPFGGNLGRHHHHHNHNHHSNPCACF